MAVRWDGWLNHYRIKLRGSEVGGKSAAQVNLCEARRVYAGNRKTPRHRALPAAGGARRQREAWVQSSPPGAPGVNWAQRPAASLSLCLSGTGVSRKHIHLWGGSLPSRMGSPPIQPATKSSSWKLPVAGAAAPRPPGAGSVPIQRVQGMACSRGAPGRTARDSERMQVGHQTQ